MTLPDPIQQSGPAQLQELQRKFNELREYAKSLTAQNSPTVTRDHTATGTTFHAKPPTPQAQDSQDARYS